MKLLQPLPIGSRTAPNRVMFGPHETNLAWGRTLSARHVAYYRERAAGGAGLVVVEEASVHPTDWPYERCPDAAEAAAGWSSIAAACRPHGTLVIAALGHSGGQGSSAYSQRELWSPSGEPEVNTQEVPKIMEAEDVAEVVDGFGRAAALAATTELDGVEVNAGQHSLLRQFLSGLTNRRDDAYGHDRVLLAREVLGAARSALRDDQLLGLRLSCDELAPWAGITPESSVAIAQELSALVDYLVVVRGAIFSVAETRPTGHHGTNVNLDLTASLRAALHDSTDEPVPVFAQGSIVNPSDAEAALTAGTCDGVEMTRAQIADPALVAVLSAGGTPRPCVLCNQRCRVRDNRNPIVSCIAEPRAGFETSDPPVDDRVPTPRRFLVVGAGPAGLEAARVAARRGHDVTVIESASETGGALRAIARAPGHQRFALLADWLSADATAAGAELRLGETASAPLVEGWDGPVILATGSRRNDPTFSITAPAVVTSPEAILGLTEHSASAVVPESVAVWDPVGNSVGVAVAELLAAWGRSVVFVTPDANAGTLLSLTGDLAGANVRLQRAGVVIERRQRLLHVTGSEARLRHTLTNAISEIAVEAVVDCSGRLPNDRLWQESGHRGVRVGDAVAARSVAEAIREGRAAVLAAEQASVGVAV